MRVLKSISPKSIIDKINRLSNVRKISDDDIIEFIAEAMENCFCFLYEENAITFVEVKDNQAVIPFGVTSINQMARNLVWSESDSENYCPSNVIDELSEEAEIIKYDCCGKPIKEDVYTSNVTYTFSSINPYFTELGYFSNFVPIRPSNNTFFNHLVQQNDFYDREQYTIKYGDLPQYQINQGDSLITFDFSEGQVAISHNRIALDDEGFPKIPDAIEVKNTIYYYILFKIAERDFFNGDQGSERRLAKFERDYDYACRTVSNLRLPDLDQMQNILENNRTMINTDQKFANFYASLGRRHMRQH